MFYRRDPATYEDNLSTEKLCLLGCFLQPSGSCAARKMPNTNANDISLHVGSHYVCSTRKRFVSEPRASHGKILRHNDAWQHRPCCTEAACIPLHNSKFVLIPSNCCLETKLKPAGKPVEGKRAAHWLRTFRLALIWLLNKRFRTEVGKSWFGIFSLRRKCNCQSVLRSHSHRNVLF